MREALCAKHAVYFSVNNFLIKIAHINANDIVTAFIENAP